MKKVYEDLWINIVKIKPPWKFLDTLQCFEKHWIAVFSFVYSKDFKYKLEQLIGLWKKLTHQTFIEANQGEELDSLYQISICILQFVKKTCKEVGASVDRCITKLEVFFRNHTEISLILYEQFLRENSRCLITVTS